MGLGRGGVVKLPAKETQRRRNETTVQWPIMHAVTYGVSRDQLMARYPANHIPSAYAKDAKAADQAMLTKAVMAEAMGVSSTHCGTDKQGEAWA